MKVDGQELREGDILLIEFVGREEKLHEAKARIVGFDETGAPAVEIVEGNFKGVRMTANCFTIKELLERGKPVSASVEATIGKDKEPIIRRFDDIEPIDDVCGEIYVLSTADDYRITSAAVVIMHQPSVPHYHKQTHEFYFVMEGEGKLFVNGERIYLEKGTFVIIPPFHSHYTIPSKLLKIYVHTVPVWTKEDQIILTEDNELVGYWREQERLALVNEITDRRNDGLKVPESMPLEDLRDKLRV